MGTTPGTEQAMHAAAPAGVSRWRGEPFRIFFPLAVLFAWAGVGHWLVYTTGLSSTYSCRIHGLVQMQAFMMAFAVGFLLTALPRRTQTPAVSRIEICALVAALITTTAGAMAERWVLSEAAYAALFVILGQFAVRRFIGRAAGRRPPAAFVLVPIAALQGVIGAMLVAAAEFSWAPGWAEGFGRLAVEQGVFLCLVLGIGSLVLPLMGGMPPPADLGSSPRERWKAIGYAAAGLIIFASLIAEQAGFERAGPLVRAATIAIGLELGGGISRAPGKPGLHRRLVWISTWMIPAGLAASALWPDYRVPALHVLFIGGFGLMAFGVATHVALGHLNMERIGLGRPPAVAALGAAFLAAMLVRVAADASDTYFLHLGVAAAVWIVGTAVWLLYFGPKMLSS
jgi:uncharacterized protein involved in response to NO